MSYLEPEFKHDIFLSYARVNNQKKGASLGWVDQLRNDLMIEISELIGRVGVIDIWRDERELGGNQYFDEEIQNTINDSALFLACNSRGYLNPESYCLKELAWFGQKMTTDRFGKQIGTRGRVFNVLINNVQRTEWPKEFEGTAGIRFNDSVERDDPGYPIEPTDPRYRIQVRKLAADIFKTLQEFKVLLKRLPDEVETTSTKYQSLTVYLAHTADTLTYTTKARLANDLRRNGAQVITDIPPRYETEEHDADLLTAVAKADLSIHLLDENPGGKLPGAVEDFYPQRQADLRLRQPGKQFIWIPETLNTDTVPNDRYGKFLQGLDKLQGTKSAYRLVRGPQSSVTREVFAELDLILKPPPPPVGITAALVDSHIKDQSFAWQLSSVLAANHVQALITSGDDDPGKNIEGFEDLLQQVSLFIIVFGRVAEDWVTARIKEAFKLAAATEHRSLKVCGVYLPDKQDDVPKRHLKFGLLPVSIPIFWFDDPKILSSVFSSLANS